MRAMYWSRQNDRPAATSQRHGSSGGTGPVLQLKPWKWRGWSWSHDERYTVGGAGNLQKSPEKSVCESTGKAHFRRWT